MFIKLETLDNVWWVPHLDKNGNFEHAESFISMALNKAYRGGTNIGYRFLRDGLDSQDNLDIVQLEGKAIHFTNVSDIRTNEQKVSYRVVDVSDVPNESPRWATDYFLSKIGWTVEDIDGNTVPRVDCQELDVEMYGENKYISPDLCVWSEYSCTYILDGDHNEVCSNGDFFHIDKVPCGVHWSYYNDSYVDEDDSCVHYGYTSHDGDRGWFYDDDCIWCDDTDSYYANSEIASDVDGVYYDHDDGEYTNKKKYNAPYRRLTRKFKMTPNTRFGIGFEVEKEDVDEYQYHYYQDIYNKYGWCKEDDASLRTCEGGFELVSPAFDLWTDDLDKDVLHQELKDMINADHSTRCGGHITVSSSLYTTNEMIEGLSAFFPLLYALYDGRLDRDGYSKPLNKHEYFENPNNEDYPAVKPRGNRTVYEADGNVFGAIELRIFSAVRSVKNLLWRRDLMRIMIENIGKSEKDVLRLLLNPKSKLFRHLLKVYSVEKIVNKIILFASHSKTYNYKVVQIPDRQEILDKLKKATNNNDSTNELGA